MRQLQELDACKPRNSREVPELLRHIESPVNLPTWERAIRNHSDNQFATYTLKGLREGFRIGYRHNTAVLKAGGKNMHCSNPEQGFIQDFFVRGGGHNVSVLSRHPP